MAKYTIVRGRRGPAGATGVAGANGDSLRNPTSFPHSGKHLKVTPLQQEQFGGADADEEKTILTATGDGVVRMLHIAPGGGFPPEGELLGYWLDVYYGTEETPSLSAPLADLVGAQNLPNGVKTLPFDSALFSLLNANTLTGACGVALKYPIPFTDGITIKLRDHDPVGSVLYATAMVQDSLPACWNRGYKLKNVRTTGTVNGPTAGAETITSTGTAVVCSNAAGFANVAVGDCIVVGQEAVEVAAKANNTHITLVHAFTSDVEATAWLYGKNREFLTLAAGKSGCIVACTAGFVPVSADQTYLEANPHFHIDGDVERTVEWAGTEDYFGGAFYWDAQDVRNDWGGVVCRNETTKAYSVYHVHKYDPIFFSNGIKGHWCNEYTTGETPAPNTAVVWDCFFYEDV